MKESIHIKNLGPIKDVYIDNIKPITVFIGESGSGKSTIMKSIALFRWIYKMHNMRSYLKKSKISKSPFRFRMDTYLKNCGLDEYITNKTEITYSVECDNSRNYTLIYNNKKLKGTSEKELIQAKDLYYNKLSFISDTRNVIPYWAERGAALSGGYLGYYFHEVYNDFYTATDNIKELNVDYLDLKLSVKKQHSSKKYYIKSLEDDYELAFKNSSSGTQSAVPITMIAEYFSRHFDIEESFNKTLVDFLFKADSIMDFKPVTNLNDVKKKLFLHIEEPELSLYPDAQCSLISDLISKCFINNQNDIELMFSTHSPYIINYLNLLIKASDSDKLVDGARIAFEDLIVYQVEDGKINNLMAKNERIVNTNALSDTINNIYDRYNQL